MPTSVANKLGPASRDLELQDDPRWQLIQRIVSSRHLAKSARLRDFLQFAGAETLQGRASELNEQRIGVHVFERKVDYDSAEDNIVRSHASRLRQRIDNYFLIEGQNESLRVCLPRGSYAPIFESVAPSEDPLRDEVPTNPVPSESVRLRRHAIAIVVLSTLLVSSLAVAAWQWHGRHQLLARPRTASPVMHALWGQVFAPGRQTLIVPADSSLVTYENLTDRTVPLSSYLDKSYLANSTPISGDPAADIAHRFAHRRLTSVADIELVAELLRIPEAIATPPTLRYARDVQVVDLKDSNAILIGARESNPWLAMFDVHRSFIIDDDQANRRFTVLNRMPGPREESIYYSQAEDPNHRAYATVALVPSLDNSGFVLIVEGTSIAGTEAGADFLFGNPSQAETLLAPAYKQYGRIPPFEVLLETTNLNGNSPHSHVVAVRMHP